MKVTKSYFPILAILLAGTGSSFPTLGKELINFQMPSGNISSLVNNFFNSNSKLSRKNSEVSLSSDSLVKVDLKQKNLNTTETNLKILSVGKKDNKLLDNSFSGGAPSVEKTQQNISSLYEEIGKEIKVNQIEDSKNKKLNSVIEKNKLNQQFSSFDESKKLVSEFLSKEKAQASQRRKRSASQREIVQMTQEQRKSLKAYFDSYSELSKESKDLLMQLQKVGQKSFELGKKVNFYSKEEVLRALERIDWEKEKIKLVGKHWDEKSNKPISFNNYGWGEWKNNPYKVFFTEQEFKDIFKNLDDGAKDLQAYLSSKRVAGLFATWLGPATVAWVYSDMDQYMKKIIGSGSKIENHIAKRLLEWMGQLKL